MNIPVVYNKYWTVCCIERLTMEIQEVDELYHSLQKAKFVAESSCLHDINQTMCDVESLRHSLVETRSIMESYMNNMERAIRVVAKKIEDADSFNRFFLNC